MSNYPPTPSFWGPANDHTQWAPHLPPDSMPHNMPFHHDSASVPPPSQSNAGHHFDYNNNNNAFFANARLPDLGGRGTAGSLPPPSFPFPGPFAAPQFPPPPFPIQMPNTGYPLMGSNTLGRAPPSRPSTGELSHPGPVNAPDSRPMTTSTSRPTSRPDFDREEGELTDMEGPIAAQPKARSHSKIGGNHFGAKNFQRRHAQAKHGNQPITKASEPESSDLEEGEASPEPQTTSRESGSPYNPPMSVNIASPYSAPKTISSTNALLPSSKPSQPLTTGSKSPAELRVQAQGAILRLAPHSIRFKELVSEGINPEVLKQLYEDVGIKVPVVAPDSFPEDIGPSEARQTGTHPQTENQAKAMPAESTTPPNPTVPEAVTTSPPAQTNADKPMERKEVIARMLAAKAAQSSRASAPPQTDVTQPIPSPPTVVTDVDKSVASTPSQEISKDREVRVKEKNKAQTELARQRIEQLKKQGLMRSQAKSQQEFALLENEQSANAQDLVLAQSPAPIQHPLPERPPDPESASSGRIPGLFMTEQADDTDSGTHVTSVQGLVVDSTPQPRVSQRKRPRASDFDEPIPVPKKSFSNGVNPPASERLVIDISDDEFYGDDEQGSMDLDTPSGDILQESTVLASEALTRSFPTSVENLPHRPGKSPSQALSLSSMPIYSRNNEQEDLRRKDLEIQAMRRKIAELEQRKKARLLSRTQSPRTSDLLALSPPENCANIELIQRAPVSAEPALLEFSEQRQEVELPSDLEQLQELRSKLVRKEEIQSGVPSLDAEIHKYEARLSEFKKGERELLLQIEKGRNGRQQLLEELKALKVELDGLSLEQVDTALSGLELDAKLPTRDEAPITEQGSSIMDIVSGPEVPCVDLQVPEVVSAQVSASSGEPFAVVTPESLVPGDTRDTHTEATSDKESSNVPISEDSGSAMDESTDSSSTSSASVDQEMSDEPLLGTGSAATEGADESLDINTETSDKSNAENFQSSLPVQLQLADTEPQADIVSSSGGEAVEIYEDLASDGSAASEAYEPPEPEATSTPADSAYSPSFSPASPPAEPMEVPESPEEQSQNTGEPLFRKVQELDLQQPSHYFLQNEPRLEESHRKFTPYVSPLQQFKAYRYHPNYTDNVSGGYRSLTYSHNIDPLKYLCPFEAAGGVCNDRSCEFQHFRDMSLSDDKVLVQMGSLREGKTPEESDNYIAGLKQIINEMRRDKVKDFNTVATEIAAYRRRFLQDHSRVLPL